MFAVGSQLYVSDWGMSCVCHGEGHCWAVPVAGKDAEEGSFAHKWDRVLQRLRLQIWVEGEEARNRGTHPSSTCMSRSFSCLRISRGLAGGSSQRCQ